MHIRFFLALLAATVLSCSPLVANATIVDHGTFLTDTDSGLDWLDVTATEGRSYNAVVLSLGNGQQFAGWRYATGSEFNALVGHATGIVPASLDDRQHYPSRSALDMLLDFLGTTDSYDTIWRIVDGLLADSFFDESEHHYIGSIEIDGDARVYSTYAHAYDAPSNYRGVFGSFLVRPSAVPEPGTIILLAAGFLAIGASRPRKGGKTVA